MVRLPLPGRNARTTRRREPEPRPERCPNCDTPLADQYCPHCGQNNRTSRLRLREMLGAGFEHLFELDVPLFRTFAGLTIRPGRVCLEYIRGQRRRYSNPLRYFILMGALYVLVLVTFDISPSRSVQRSMQTPGTSAGSSLVTEVPDPTIESGDRNASRAADPAGTSETPDRPEPTEEQRRAEERRERGQRIAAYIGEHASRRVEESLNLIMLVAVPFLALAYLVLFRRPRYTFAEHLVFVLFIYGQDLVISLVASLVGLFNGAWGLVATQTVSAAYMTWAACVFYRAGVLSTLGRILLAFLWYMVVTMVLGVLYLAAWIAWLFLSGEIFERI